MFDPNSKRPRSCNLTRSRPDRAVHERVLTRSEPDADRTIPRGPTVLAWLSHGSVSAGFRNFKFGSRHTSGSRFVFVLAGVGLDPS